MKMLLIGGAYADIPMILAARKLGYHVATTGNRPDAPGHGYSDEYHQADLSDPDAMLKLARRLNVSAVVPGCNDFCALSASYVAEHMGLPGNDPHEVAQIIHHKDAYREFALANGIPTPMARGFTSIESALEWIRPLQCPIIIKPVDLGSGKGISVARGLQEAGIALANAFTVSKAGRVVVEEFLEGSRHGFSAFLRDRKVVFAFFDDEHYYKNPYLVSAASTPGSVAAEVRTSLVEEAEKIAAKLQLNDGIFHVQFILHEGRAFIIEICRRPPGDLYVSLVSHATGVDYPSWIVKAAAGMDCSDLKQAEPIDFFTRHCIMAEREGTLAGIEFDADIEENIIEKKIFCSPGDRIADALVQRFGIVFLRFSSMEEMHEKTRKMETLIRVKVH